MATQRSAYEKGQIELLEQGIIKGMGYKQVRKLDFNGVYMSTFYDRVTNLSIIVEFERTGHSNSRAYRKELDNGAKAEG